MEQLQADIEGKRKLLLFTLGKTESVLESGRVLVIKRHREALNTIANQIDILKLQVVEETFEASHSKEDIALWSRTSARRKRMGSGSKLHEVGLDYHFTR